MKKYLPLLKLAKNALITFAISSLLSIGLIVALLNYNTTHEESLGEADASVQSKQSETQTLTDNLSMITSHRAEFDHLTNIGLVGNPNRANWAEQFDAIYRDLNLPLTLRYALEAPRPLADPGTTPPPSPSNALRHELNIELSDLHEEEFLLFMAKLNTRWAAPFRINNCDMTRSSQTKLDVKCTIRLFTLPGPASAADQTRQS